jgi:hypothetical protein
MVKSGRTDFLDSGLPGWLIKIGFILYLFQALLSMTFVEEGSVLIIGDSIVFVRLLFLAGDAIFYSAMIRGMRPLKQSFTWLFGLLIVIDIARVFLSLSLATPTLSVIGRIVGYLVMFILGIYLASSFLGNLKSLGIMMVIVSISVIISSLLWSIDVLHFLFLFMECIIVVTKLLLGIIF